MPAVGEANDRQALRRLLDDRLLPKLRAEVEALGGAFPIYGEGDRWVLSAGNRWCDGFWPGTLWLAWALSDDPALRDAAEDATRRLSGRVDDAWSNFDVGFLFAQGAALPYCLTGDPAHRKTALAAAERLFDFHNEAAGAITYYGRVPEERTADHLEHSLIDVLMVLTLLWWAARETGERRFADLAETHVRTAAAHQVRRTGAVWQQVDFDRKSGAVVACGTRHGASPSGCWARAQAWAVHGFLQAAAATSDPRFAATAGQVWNHWRRAVPADGVPLWDLALPPGADRDASAAAIVLAGLAKAPAWGLELPGRTALLEATWRGLTTRLAGPDAPGLLTGGSAYPGRGEGRSGATVWGDYYLMEALVHLTGVQSKATGFPL